MKLKRIILLLLTVMFFLMGEVFAKDGNSLKKALKQVLIGVSVNTHQSSVRMSQLLNVKKNFNSIVAENCMKSSSFIRKKISIICAGR